MLESTQRAIQNELNDIFTTTFLAIRINSARVIRGSRHEFKISADKETHIIRNCIRAIEASGRIKQQDCKTVIANILKNPKANFYTFAALWKE